MHCIVRRHKSMHRCLSGDGIWMELQNMRLAQVILELEGKVAAEIISGYGEVTAQALESDPTVCLVTFSFTVAQGLNQIWLSAQITV